MHLLCSKTCPSCGSRNTKRFENKCTLLPEHTTPHYMCIDCRTLWGIGCGDKHGK